MLGCAGYGIVYHADFTVSYVETVAQSPLFTYPKHSISTRLEGLCQYSARAKWGQNVTLPALAGRLVPQRLTHKKTPAAGLRAFEACHNGWRFSGRCRLRRRHHRLEG